MCVCGGCLTRTGWVCRQVREFTPQLMSLVAVIAVYLLWFAAHTIYKDHQKVCAHVPP